MDLSDYIRILRKNWLVVVALTLLGLGAAFAYTATRTPIYESSSTVFVSTQAGSTTAELQQGSVFTQARINTYVGLVNTPIVLDRVIGDLALDTTSDELATEVTASAAQNSTLISVVVKNPSPQAAADIANAIAQSLATVVPQLEPEADDGSSPVRLSRVRDAKVPLAPSSPSFPLNLAIGGLIGLAVGVGTAVLRTALDNRVRTPRDAEQATGAPSIGAIALRHEGQGTSAHCPRRPAKPAS